MILFQKNSKKDRDRQVCTLPQNSILCSMAKNGILSEAIKDYLLYCQEYGKDNLSEKAVKSKGRFPNIAGLCRYLNTGMSDVFALRDTMPEEYDKLLAIFEDEALNSQISPTVISAYMKKRIGFVITDEGADASGEVLYEFEHNIFADGE